MPDTHLPSPPGRISRLPVAERGSEAPAARALVEQHHGENWIRALALNPDFAARFSAYFQSLFRAEGARLPLQERELIAVVVSASNGCGLCEIHHTLALGEALGDPVRARRIALDPHLAGLSAREHALVAFALKVTRQPRDVSDDDFQALRDAGLDDGEILEALETSAWFNHTNRVFISLGVPPDDAYFAR
ncbi:Peroxidase-related enzyme [Rhodovastum atsumiense]|uniref:Peroxidase-related enzyme n=1 Tax=Rhodovastum atsumiense TaxID=504468 RepID=A0A5M6IWT1_9PROT|nr:peroxidase-related enzyme [Rhodovastum atsumiense]KAA5612752.1 peroxidase-related enzyme [Rhodovastum atsumiense]CAH2602686.1 Peroxidase-related enzyme [Rhodovastum atsumiense]